MNEINLVDTTLRDGDQSVWGMRMTTGMMVPILSDMDRVGFSVIDYMSSAQFKNCISNLREDPWERIRFVAKAVRRTPLNLMARASISTFGIAPMSIQKVWFECMATNGIKRVQLHEINDFGFRLSQNLQFARDAGLKVALALIYSHSPKHTNEYYAEKAQEAMKLKPDIIYLKDPGGLLTPERTKTLIPVIFQNINGMPFELHSHCTTGLAPLCYLEAIRLGVKTLHTCIPPLANSSAQPSMVNIASNARFMGYTPTITDEEAIEPITAHFRYIARREGLPIGAPVEYNVYQYTHQVPGGVISTLREQLTQIKMQHRLGEVLEETIQVRKDLGYPVMVTPFSQHVVTQATINVMLGERYKEVIEELIQYAVGFWGEEAKSAIEPNLMDRIMSLPRAKEIANWEPPEPSIKEMRQKYGGPGISDEELLLRYMGREEELEAVRAAGPIKEYPSTRTPLLTLIRELTKQKDSNYISIQKGELSLTIQKY